jgi:pilus assembly protein CpaE
MKNVLNVLLIEDSPDYAELVQQWLSGESDQFGFALNWTDTLETGLNRLARGSVDVILLDLGLPDSEGVDTYLAIRACAPQTPVIILSAGDGESLALRMIQEGAEDYLVKSTCHADLLVRALRYAVVRRRSQVGQTRTDRSTPNARVLGILGAKGGVGTTTIACNLAAELRQQTNQEVLLTDFDLHTGLVPFLLAIEPKYSILDAISNMHRLDRDCWQAIVTHGLDGLDVMPAPNCLNKDEPGTESLGQLLFLSRSFYDWIVADLGTLGDLPTSILERVDELFIVTTASLSALYQAKRAIDAAVDAGLERDRLRLIINQTEQVQALSRRELNNTFGVPVYGMLPNDSQQLHQACLQKKLADRSSAFGTQLGNLARKVAGLQEEASAKRRPELWSFMGKLRRNSAATAVKDEE